MRILTVSNLYPPVYEGGYELRCAATMDALRDQHEIFVLTSERGREGCPPDPGIRRELPFTPPGAPSVLKAPVTSARGMDVMRRALAELQPDLIFIWNGQGIPHAALRVAEQSGIPLAYSVGEHWLGRIYRSDPFVRFLLAGESGVRAAWGHIPRALNHHPSLQVDPYARVPAAIVWNSEATREQCGVPPTLIAVHEATIYPAVSEPGLWTGTPRQPGAEPAIAFVGRVEEEKGPDVAYRALAELRDRHGIRAKLSLAGTVEPQMGAELERLAAELGIAEQVELLGRLDKPAVAGLLARSHALLVPSTWEEPFGLVLLEGALARIPVVASRSGGMPEALEEGTEALFFPVGDPAACAAALADTLNDPVGTDARVEKAFERAASLSFDRYIAEMAQFLADAHAALSGVRGSVGTPV
jgi:glycosyltransferase involved in cell wall biosynthesis